MKTTIISIIAVVALIGAAFLLTKNNNNVEQVANVNNVTIVGGTQIIELTAKGGYQPLKSIAKAGIPTILRFDTQGTFDCSSSVRIPSMDISKILPNSGATDIDLGSPKVGTLQGLCGMGMYDFSIDFQS